MLIQRLVRAVLIFAPVASLTALASVAHSSLTDVSPQEAQLERTCSDALASIRIVQQQAAVTQPAAIVAHLDVIDPGVLSAKIVFNRSGSTIRVAADRSSSSLTCAQTVGHVRGLGPGPNRVVSTLNQRFTKPGHYTLRFVLNPTGRKLLADLAAAQRAYRQTHPHGHQPPGLAYGVGLAYSSSSTD